MNNLELLTNALEYVESHLQEDICTEDVAKACFCSKSTLEKLFKCVNHTTVRDYLVRRRLTQAAKMLVEQPEVSVLDVAIKFGYSTNESFSRAFKQMWNCQPSKFRENERVMDLYPRLTLPLENGDNYMRERVNFDISELYDLLKARKDCYFVCSDIKHLVPINEISHKAGDYAILEALRRMTDAAGEKDIVFRIGGDEFVMLTDSADIAYAEGVAKQVRSHNEECFAFEDQKIPLSLHVTVTRFEANTVKYDELFTGLHTALRECK